MIDTKLLPARVMVDTNVFMRGVLGHRSDDLESPLCKSSCDAMLENGHRIFVAAPTLAEIIRHQGQRIPRTQNIVVVPFDERAAELLGLNMPMAKLHQTKAASGATLTYLKYDAMIMACALRSGATVFVTMDEDHHALAPATGIQIQHPKSFRTAQLSLDALIHGGPGATSLAKQSPNK